MSKIHAKTAKRLPRLRVFILGAGVSAACGVPVAKDIFRATKLRLLDVKTSAADEVHKVLRYLHPGFYAKLKNYPNIEDFPNFLEMAKRFNTEEFVRSDSTPREPRPPRVYLRGDRLARGKVLIP